MKRSPEMDKFEQLLSQQPLRGVPPGWRREILADRQPRWREWLWPSPVAWATVAAVWLVILGLQLTTHSTPVATVPDMDLAAALAEQRRVLAELQPPPAPVPGPQSAWKREEQA